MMSSVRFLITLESADRQYSAECSIDLVWAGIMPVGSEVNLASIKFPIKSQIAGYGWDSADPRALLCRLNPVTMAGNKEDIQSFLDGFHKDCNAKILQEVP